MTPKAETIASTSRLTVDEARKLIALGKARGWLTLRKDATVVQFSPKGTTRLPRPAQRP